MFAVIYRWRLHTGAEESFVDGWTRVTRAIYAQCGSYGYACTKLKMARASPTPVGPTRLPAIAASTPRSKASG